MFKLIKQIRKKIKEKKRIAALGNPYILEGHPYHFDEDDDDSPTPWWEVTQKDDDHSADVA